MTFLQLKTIVTFSFILTKETNCQNQEGLASALFLVYLYQVFP